MYNIYGLRVSDYSCCYCLSHINGSATKQPCRGHKIDGTKPNQTGSTFEDKKSRQKRLDKKVASKGHRRDQQEAENTNKITNRRNKLKNA